MPTHPPAYRSRCQARSASASSRVAATATGGGGCAANHARSSAPRSIGPFRRLRDAADAIGERLSRQALPCARMTLSPVRGGGAAYAAGTVSTPPKGRPMAGADPALDTSEPGWRERAVSRSVHAARSRAEERVQKFLDAAFTLVDEKGSTEFTIQEVVDRSKQSLRSFYEYFDGKDELVLALFEESIREADDDIRAAVEAESDPLDRLRAFAIRLH